MNIDFPLVLVSLTFLCGIIWFIDSMFFENKRKISGGTMSVIADYGRSFFPVFLIVLIIRSFIVQPFRVPTGSLEPTIQLSDFIVVSQYAYGIRLPVLNTKILNVGEPKRGDIAVFRYPVDPSINYVKRVIGVPGDHIVYKNRVLTINGKVMKQTYLKDYVDDEGVGYKIESDLMEEDLDVKKHEILLWKKNGKMDAIDITVPEGQYFMMGDNRDDSADSRYWGFVPEANLIGKGLMVWMSWDSEKYRIRFERIGKKL